MNQFYIDYNNNKTLYIYYLILHFICLSWINIDLVAPSNILRVIVTAAVFVPLIKNFWLAPSVFILFVGLRFNSVSPFGYIPQSWFIYECIIIFIAILHCILYKNKSLLSLSRSQLLLLLFVVLVDIINFQLHIEFYAFILLLFIFYNAIKSEKALNVSLLSFVILTITLSIYYFVFAEQFAEQFYRTEDVSRSTWLDPNYFGILLGCGIIISSAYLFSNTKLNQIYKILFIICCVLGYIVIILQASRGATLAVSVTVAFFVLFSGQNIYRKILFILFLLAGVVFLYNNGYFQLLEMRTLNDDTGGSGRLEIWSDKINDWIKTPFQFLGCGYQSSIYNFAPLKTDCHNEIISILINYGLAGVLIMIVSVYKLLFRPSKILFVWGGIIYILLAFATLSPISVPMGWIATPFLLLLLYKYKQLANS